MKSDAEFKKYCYDKWWMHSKPVAVSLEILDRLGLIEYIEGRTDGPHGFLPFTVCLKKEIDGSRFICKPTDLHQTLFCL